MKPFVIIQCCGGLGGDILTSWCQNVEKIIEGNKIAMTIIENSNTGRPDVLKALSNANDTDPLLYYGHGSYDNLTNENGGCLLSGAMDWNLLRSRFCYLVACWSATLADENEIIGCDRVQWSIYFSL